MHIVIDIPNEEYKTLSELSEKEKVNELSYYERIIAQGIPYEERPKGEWIETVERRGCFVGDETVYSYTCPFCGAKEFKKYPFCHCGAKMKGGAE